MKTLPRPDLVPFFLALATIVAALPACEQEPSSRERVAAGLEFADEFTLTGNKNLFTDYAAINEDGDLNVVVEIPTGSIAKWEVDKSDGSLRWKFKNQRPRVVNYLGYPGNYGMVPRTIYSKEAGGDGDPLDAIVIGPAVPRGSVVAARLIGVLRLIDRGEQDDKLIAVMADTPFYEVEDLEELDDNFRGALPIIETWFANYKGPGKIESQGFGGVDEAREILARGMASFDKTAATR